MKYLYLMLGILLMPLHAEHYKQTNPDILEAIEQVLDQIYYLSVSEIQEIVSHDFGSIVEITADELLARREQESDLLVINVLTEHWYNDCHIEGSVNVPLHQLIYVMKDVDRSVPLVVYCALDACDAGQKAYVLLRCMGFSAVVDYPGGIKEWFQLGHATTGPCAEEYLHGARCFDCPSAGHEFDFKKYLAKTRYIYRFARHVAFR